MVFEQRWIGIACIYEAILTSPKNVRTTMFILSLPPGNQTPVQTQGQKKTFPKTSVVE